MKQKLVILLSIIFTFIFATHLSSCSNNESNDILPNNSKSEEILQKYARFHNSGLDYIKYEAKKTSDKYTQKHLEAALGNYVISVYGKNNANKIIKQIAPMEELTFNGNIPSLPQLTRSNDSPNNSLAVEAANECMNKITNYLKTFKDNEIFDNKFLLSDLHTIIIRTYNDYASKSNSDKEKEMLAQSLGVLYGSIEYWTNSDNVNSWSKIDIEASENTHSKITTTKNKVMKKAKENKNSKKLSKVDYITVVAAADTAGSFLGAAVASGPAAVAASAAAALYFDVE